MFVAAEASVHAARMSTPGAAISGFSTLGLIEAGPRDENIAIAGAGLTPSTVSGNSTAVGFAVLARYARMTFPMEFGTTTVGRT